MHEWRRDLAEILLMGGEVVPMSVNEPLCKCRLTPLPHQTIKMMTHDVI